MLESGQMRSGIRLKRVSFLQLLDILFIEPYDGGSHNSFRMGIQSRSGHRVNCLRLPPRFWKWRMRGGAVYFADLINDAPPPRCDLLLVTSMLNLADLKSLLDPPLDRVPCVLYMHENQLTYPLSPDEEFDFHFGFTNIISALAADHVIFNSDFHRELFLSSLPSYLGKMPEAVPRDVAPRLRDKSSVLPVGLERSPLPAETFAPYRGGSCAPDSGPSWPGDGQSFVLLWNHRWEFDKRPDLFARAVNRLLDDDLDVRVLLLGEPLGHEDVFSPLRDRLGARCLHFGYVPDRQQYEKLLACADIVVSCAEQEYFGISVAEAIHAGAYPVLPRRQVYPSLYGSKCQGRHFYNTEDELVALLTDLCTTDTCGHVCSLSLDCDEFCWDRLIPRYDKTFARIVETAGGGS